MLDTRTSPELPRGADVALRCDALIDRVSAIPVGSNPHALDVMLAECELLERAAPSPFAVCKLRDARHWIRLAYGHELHAYPASDLRRAMLASLEAFRASA